MLLVVAETGQELDLGGGKIQIEQALGVDAPRDINIGRHDPLDKRAPVLPTARLFDLPARHGFR